MPVTMIPLNYQPKLDCYDVQQAIDYIKVTFQGELCQALNLHRVSAPLFVPCESGRNDTLTGVERPVNFDIPAFGSQAEVVQSLAKWKRCALAKYHFHEGEGLLTDMNAIRRDEPSLDNIHSIYVDQWDWEKIITPEERCLDYLRETVQQINNAICNVNHLLQSRFAQLDTRLRRQVTFFSAQELEDLYPEQSPDEREKQVAEEYQTVFIWGIGGKLASGQPHGLRAPDYDDWMLNGDLIFWNPVLNRAFELSSMGIRVDAASLERQLQAAGRTADTPYHQALRDGKLPYTIGGGIGQSRLCMLLIGCSHIGEVQSSIWDDETIRLCQERGVLLL